MSAEVIIKTIGDEPVLNAAGLSLLFGVPANEIKVRLTFNAVLPDEWVRAGRRRKSEAAAHASAHSLLDVLRYWAAKECLVIVEVEQ